MHANLPRTLGELRESEWAAHANRTVKDEMRQNLMHALQSGAKLFPGVQGYEETVLPQVINAILAKHNFILLGLRGQAKTRLIRMLTTLLDEWMPYLEGSEIRDNPFAPLSQFGRELVAEHGEATPIAWLHRDQRYVEKLATPDVTIADMIGDIDPIKAAKQGREIGNELTMHYGLVPRANRGIFGINELPDLAGKIQVGLFNILQEGDVQIKGYPLRLPLDIQMVFTANPEDYTARGKIITPLKDRIGSEIRTHYPLSVDEGMNITAQEAWTRRSSPVSITVPKFIREVVESVAFLARDDKRVDRRSGVSQRLPISVLETVVSNAERRSLLNKEAEAVPRIVDIYTALPSITGKLELEYEGELKGGEAVARELIRMATGRVFSQYFEGINLSLTVKYFERGGQLQINAATPASAMLQQMAHVDGLLEKTGALGIGPGSDEGERASAAEFILEGLYAHRRISRNEATGTFGEEKKDKRDPERREGDRRNEAEDEPRGKKNRTNYN